MTRDPISELVTGAEIGRRLGVSRERVRQWASNPRYRFPAPLGRIGRAVVWRWADVAAWAQGRDIGRETRANGDAWPREDVKREEPR